MKDYKPTKVSKLTAQNPVARAMAWANLRKHALGTKIKLLSLKHGEEAREWLLPIERFYSLVLLACEIEKSRDKSPEHVSMLKHIEQALMQIWDMRNNGFKWHMASALDQCDALDYCEELTRDLSAASINKAISEAKAPTKEVPAPPQKPLLGKR